MDITTFPIWDEEEFSHRQSARVCDSSEGLGEVLTFLIPALSRYEANAVTARHVPMDATKPLVGLSL